MYAQLCSGHGMGEPRNLGTHTVQARHGMLLMPWHQSSLPALHSRYDGLGSEKAEAELTCFARLLRPTLTVSCWCCGAQPMLMAPQRACSLLPGESCNANLSPGLRTWSFGIHSSMAPE